MKTITIKLLTIEEANDIVKQSLFPVPNQSMTASSFNTASEDSDNSLVFIVDSTTQADIKKAITGKVLNTMKGMNLETVGATD